MGNSEGFEREQEFPSAELGCEEAPCDSLMCPRPGLWAVQMAREQAGDSVKEAGVFLGFVCCGESFRHGAPKDLGKGGVWIS